jgi:hypothetical protein
VLLLFPAILYFLGLPSQTITGKDISGGIEVDLGQESKGVDYEVSFQQLEIASMTPEARDYYTGKVVRLFGVYTGEDESRFTLTKPAMTCCYADMRQLKAVIVVNYKNVPSPKDRLVPSTHNGKWVQVTGMVQFAKRETGEYVTTLVVVPEKPEDLATQVKKLSGPPPNAFTS